MSSVADSSGFRPNFPTQRRVERISQAAVTIHVRDGSSAFASVRAVLLTWLRSKAGHDLPPAMLAGEFGTHDLIGAQRTETATIADPPYWAARQDDQDRNLARRTWVTEVSLAQPTPNTLRIGYRLHCVTGGDSAGFSRSVPRFMRSIAQMHTVYLDDQEIDLRATEVETVEDVSALVELLLNPTRSVPVIAVSAPSSDNGAAVLIDADMLAKNVFGCAHVRRLSWSAAFELTRQVGKRLSCFGGAIRMWRPHRPLDDGAAFDHPLTLTDRILDAGADQVLRDVVDDVLRVSAGRRDAEELVPSFAEIRRVASAEARLAAKQAGRDDELLSLLEADNQRLIEEKRELEEFYKSFLASEEREFRSLQADYDEVRQQIISLNARNAMLVAAVRERADLPDVPLPADFDGVAAWAELYLGEDVILTSRAIRAARKSLFDNPPIAYQALLLLKDAYVPMRRSGSDMARQRWLAGLQHLGLDDAPTFSGTRAGQFGDEYFVDWRGRRRELERHLKGSNSRDPRRGFRLYFFWCGEQECAVVGAFPTHLTNDAT